MTTLEDKCENLYKSLLNLAPTLFPCFLCISIDDLTKSIKKLHCSNTTTEKIKKNMNQIIQNNPFCTVCKRKTDSLELHLSWNFQATKKCFKMNDLKVLCNECRNLSQITKLATHLSFEDSNNSSLITLFNNINSNSKLTPEVEQFYTIQETCCISFCLRTLTKSLRERLYDFDSNELTCENLYEALNLLKTNFNTHSVIY